METEQEKAEQETSHEQLLALWENDAKKICNANGMPDPTVVIRDDKTNENVSINGSKIIIGPKLLGQSQDVRLYFLAHELGHLKSKHDLWFWIVLSVCALPLIWEIATTKNVFHMLLDFAVGAVFFAAYVYATNNRAMFFEYQADAVGAKLLDKVADGQGVASMINGMERVKNHRIESAVSGEDKAYHAQYYQSRINKLTKKGPFKWWIHY